MDNKSQKITDKDNTTPEIRAYIYQQLADLEFLLPQGTAVSVLVEDLSLQDKKTKEKRSSKKVIMQLETSVGNLMVESADKDVYIAIQRAKDDLKGQLSTLQNFISGESRQDIIDNIITQKYLH